MHVRMTVPGRILNILAFVAFFWTQATPARLSKQSFALLETRPDGWTYAYKPSSIPWSPGAIRA